MLGKAKILLQTALLTVILKFKKNKKTKQTKKLLCAGHEGHHVKCINRDPHSQRDDSRQSEIRGTGVSWTCH